MIGKKNERFLIAYIEIKMTKRQGIQTFNPAFLFEEFSVAAQVLRESNEEKNWLNRTKRRYGLTKAQDDRLDFLKAQDRHYRMLRDEAREALREWGWGIVIEDDRTFSLVMMTGYSNLATYNPNVDFF